MPRDSSGAYTLPSGNPVVDGTIIESTWANPTMSDIAVQLNNVLTRDGLLGPIQPMLFVNGTIPLPGIAFQESPSTGLNRTPPATLNMVINGVVRQLWNPTGTQMVGTASVSGDVSIGGNLTVTGTAALLLGPGTALLPTYSFSADPNTGMYNASPDTLGFSTAGLLRALITSDGVISMSVPTNPSAPNMVMAVSAGGFGLDVRGRAGDNLAVMRLLSQDYTTALLSIRADSTLALLGTDNVRPLQFFTNGIVRISISGNGEVVFAAPTSGVHTINGSLQFTGPTVGNGGDFVANNYYINGGAAGAGTFGIASGLGAAMVTWGNASAGGGALDLVANGSRQIQFQAPGGAAVNYWVMTGSLAGLRAHQYTAGVSPDIGIQWTTKGSGDYAWFGNGGVHLQVTTTMAAASTWVQITGGNNVPPTYPIITTNAARLSMTAPVRFTGPISVAGDLVQAHTQASFATFSFIDPSRNPNDKVAELIFTAGGLQARFLNDANNDARTIWAAQGGVALGVTNTSFFTGHQDPTMQMTSGGVGGGRGLVSLGAFPPVYQLQISGAGQVGPNVFDLNSASLVNGGVIYLGDTGNAAGNGGCVMFGAFPGPVANGQHFAAIKAFITDASGFTAGALYFNLKNTSADTGSTPVMSLHADRRILDSRNLPLVRDIGAAPLVAAAVPVGTIVLGLIGSGININALTTINAATQNITIQGTSAGTNVVITFGTWRNIGATTTNSLAALWIRTA